MITESDMKRTLILVIVAIWICGALALVIWNVMLNWHHRLGFGEYPVSFWIGEIIFVIVTACLLGIEDKIKKK